MKQENNFTPNELSLLRKKGLVDNNGNIRSTTYPGFGYYILRKLDNDEIEEINSYPTNVDPDDGSYDSVKITRYYHNFENFIDNKPYFEEKN